MTEKRFKLAYSNDMEHDKWWAVRDWDITLWKEEVVHLLNEQHETITRLQLDRDSLATGFDEYQVQVAETLQKHYNQTLNTHIARFVKLLAEELGIDLQ